MSNQHVRVYWGILGKIIHNGQKFVAWKDGFWIGTYDTLVEALETLVWREMIRRN
jgi:hypothetical protein